MCAEYCPESGIWFAAQGMHKGVGCIETFDNLNGTTPVEWELVLRLKDSLLY